MFSWIRNSLSEEARQKGIDPSSLTFFKRVGGDLSSGGKALFEILGPKHQEPLWVAKAARSPQGNQRLKQEYERLLGLHQRIPPPLRQSLPRPIAFDERATGSISLETALSGEKISRLLREQNQKDPWLTWESCCRLSLDWYQQFANGEPRHTRCMEEVWWRENIHIPLNEKDHFLGKLSPHWSGVSQAIEETRFRILNRSMESIFPHGDFTPANLLLDGQAIRVFDWSPEDSNLPPACDLFHFLVSSSLYLGQSLERKLNLFDLKTNIFSDERFLKPFRPYVLQYFKDFAIPLEMIRPLFLVSVGNKIISYVSRPEPICESLHGWIFSASCWLEGEIEKAFI